MTTYIRGENPIWFYSNLVGLPFDDTYYAFFLTNTLPYLPQAPFQTPNGTAWPYIIEFQPGSALPNNLYFDPSLTYRIEFRQGPTQADPLIYLVENYIPGNGGGSGAITDYLTINPNLITNPQFADISFQTPYTFSMSTPGTYTINVGEGWQLVMVGYGSVTLTQNPIAGDNNNPENPPYSLTVNSSGTWSSVQLVQKLQNNGALFAKGAIAISFEAYATTNAKLVTVTYDPITGTSQNLFQGMVTPGGLTVYSGYIDIDPSTNALTGTSAYVNLLITLPNVGVVTITNIQLTGQSTPLSDEFIENPIVPLFQEQSYNQIVNGEFYLYRDPLKFKPIPSYLVGWDFPLNPTQFVGENVAPQANGANSSYYVWDQTIIYQEVTSAASVSRASNNGIKIDAAATSKFALIQYLPAPIVNNILSDTISVNVRGQCATNSTINATVSLWYTKGSSLPTITPGTYQSIVATLDDNGKPATFNQPTGGTWIEVARNVSNEATFALTDTITDFGFNGWEIAIESDAPIATYFAIVIGFSSITMSTISPSIISVGLCSGDVPTIPAPQTLDDVLRECQFYYEKSWPRDTPVATANFIGAECAEISVYPNDSSISTQSLTAVSFNQQYKQTKNSIPQHRFYSPQTGTRNFVTADIFHNGTVVSNSGTPFDLTSNTWSITNSVSNDNCILLCQDTSSSIISVTGTINYRYEGLVRYHYTLDSTLGGPIGV